MAAAMESDAARTGMTSPSSTSTVPWRAREEMEGTMEVTVEGIAVNGMSMPQGQVVMMSDTNLNVEVQLEIRPLPQNPKVPSPTDKPVSYENGREGEGSGSGS